MNWSQRAAVLLAASVTFIAGSAQAQKPIRVFRNGIRKGLQSDVPLQTGVARPINLSHAAPPDRGNDFVRAHARAACERHVFRSL